MGRNDLAGDVQTKPGVLAEVLVGPISVEALENALQILRRDPRSLVLDGHLDLVGLQAARLAVMRGDGAFGFGPPLLSTAAFPPDRITLDDFDGDGVLDVAFTGSDSNRFGVMFGVGNGRFVSTAGCAGVARCVSSPTATCHAR